MAKKTYTALEPLRHDGTDYEIGETVEMEEKLAKQLPEGTLGPAETKAAPTKPAK